MSVVTSPAPTVGAPAATSAGAPGAPAAAGASTPSAPVRRRGGWKRPARVILSVIVIFAVWAIASTQFPSYILPSPLDVWDQFLSAVGRGVWVEEILATVQHLLAAFGLVIVIGLPLGILIGRSKIAEDLARVPMIFLQTVPTIVLIALALVIMGVSDTAVIGVTVAGSISYFLINVIQGTRSIDPDLTEMSRAYQASEGSIMRSVVLPSVVPYLLAGARITLGVAWQITLFSEYLMGTAGVGFQVNTSIKLLDTAAVFMWGLSIVALTLLVEYGIFRPVERLLTRHVKGRS
ncbi:ABC transporter permease [Herbiconiux sp.]|uniref:ABC transporter permease n=1 Tax=Herbiconiux sp. TaxID=1871186 RepID=UPI0025BF8193|nr:ABC transporter permease [Herbiconiux sp.]